MYAFDSFQFLFQGDLFDWELCKSVLEFQLEPQSCLRGLQLFRVKFFLLDILLGALASFSFITPTTRWWSEPISALLLARTSWSEDLHLLPTRKWSIWFSVNPFGEIQVTFWHSLCGNQVPPIDNPFAWHISIKPFPFLLKLPCLSPWRLLFLCFRYSIEVSNDNFDVSPFYLLQSCLELMVQIMFVFIFGIVCGCIHLDDGHFECQQSNQQSNLAVMTLSDTGSHSSSPVAASLLSRRPTPLLWLATFSPSPLGPENGKVSPVVSCVFPKFVHHISLTPMIASCDLLISLANCAVFPQLVQGTFQVWSDIGVWGVSNIHFTSFILCTPGSWMELLLPSEEFPHGWLIVEFQ